MGTACLGGGLAEMADRARLIVDVTPAELAAKVPELIKVDKNGVLTCVAIGAEPRRRRVQSLSL